MSQSGGSSPAMDPGPNMTDLLTAHNMKRLLEAYRTLAPLTIGGPASTSLETSPAGLLSTGAGRTDPLIGRRGLHQQQLLLLQHPPPPPPQPFLWSNNSTSADAAAAVCGRIEDGRRRHSSCSSLSSHHGRPVLSPHHSRAHYQHHHYPASASSSPSATGGDHPSLFPVFSAKDSESSSLVETLLEGRRISCFSVGGELRLCLTQILQLVLHSVPLHTIHQACEELQIFCSTSSPAQLTSLKLARVLPLTTTQCGLITRSDAERLCSLLLHTNPSSSSNSTSSSSSSPPVSPPRTADPGGQLRVQHNCFGTCVGLLSPLPGSGPDTPCIECTECNELFSPSKFVCHSHQAPDRGIVHWGFSRDNWPAYIQVWEEYSEEEKENHQKELTLWKQSVTQPPLKRKSIESGGGVGSKRRRPGEERWRSGETDPPALEQAGQLPGIAAHTFTHFPPFDKALFSPSAENRFVLPWGVASLPAPYLQSLAHLHSLKLLLEQQQHHVARNILQASLYNHATDLKPQLQLERKNEEEELLASRPTAAAKLSANTVAKLSAGAAAAAHGPLTEEEEFVMGVADVLAGAGVEGASREVVLGVVERLVSRLHVVQKEKDSANHQIRGMEARITRLEKELREKIGFMGEQEEDSVTKTDEVEGLKQDDLQGDETSSDGGIESGTDDLSEK